jgi:RNA polymerase sigma factor (sigma-70 family)
MDNSTLYQACRSDGTDAQIDAFQLLSGELYRIAYAMLYQRADGEALAADCVQIALEKIYRNLDQCREPGQFRAWAAQITRRAVLDLLRRAEMRRTVALPEEDYALPAAATTPALEPEVDLAALLQTMIATGPLSERSRRVVLGRFFEEQSDEVLAKRETDLSGSLVLPSHVQVTRAKNIDKLRKDSALLERLRELL